MIALSIALLVISHLAPCEACGELHIVNNQAHVCAECADTDLGCELIHGMED